MPNLVCGISTIKDVVIKVTDLEADAKKKINTVVILGASILDSAFDTGQNAAVAALQLELGTDVTVVDEAVAGDKAADLVARLGAILTTYSGDAGILFIVHIGGGNVSATRPYSSATEAELLSISTNLKSIINDIQAGNHELLVSSLTFRNYSNVPPNSNGSLPYNDAIFLPIIKNLNQKAWNFATERPVLDLYTLLEDNQDWLDTDGIHMLAAGEDGIRRNIFKVVSEQFDILDASPSTTASLTPFYPYAGAKFVMDMSDGTQSNTSISRVKSDELVSRSADTIISLPVLISGTGAGDGHGATGKGNSGNTSTSLLNDQLLTNFAYISTNDGFIKFEIGGILPLATGTLTVTASRDISNTDRVGVVTVGSLTQNLDAILDPPAILSFPFTVSATGYITLTLAKPDTSAFAYISGMQLIFD